MIVQKESYVATYYGREAGQRMLDDRMPFGTPELMHAVIWSSSMRLLFICSMCRAINGLSNEQPSQLWANSLRIFLKCSKSENCCSEIIQSAYPALILEKSVPKGALNP
jgi:hypothetical protein